MYASCPSSQAGLLRAPQCIYIHKYVYIYILSTIFLSAPSRRKCRYFINSNHKCECIYIYVQRLEIC